MNEIYKNVPVLLSQQTSTEVPVSSTTDSEASGESSLSSAETTEIMTETETGSGAIQVSEAYMETNLNLSIATLVALGLLIGLQAGKIFLDKIWR